MSYKSLEIWKLADEIEDTNWESRQQVTSNQQQVTSNQQQETSNK